MEAVLGDAVLRWLRIRKGPRKEQYDPNAIATQPSIWDSDNVEEYKQLYIHPQWENMEAFDPSARWTWKEEREVRHKVDLKIMVSKVTYPSSDRSSSLCHQVWVCIMFAALNIVRGNISNAVSDNMLDDLNLTRADYVREDTNHLHIDEANQHQNLGFTIFRIAFLTAELPSQLISKR